MRPLGSATPFTSRCTRYVAMHPNRRGVMHTDRVHCQWGQVNLRSVNGGAPCVEKRRGHLLLYPRPILMLPPRSGARQGGGLAIHRCLLVSSFIHRA